MVLCAATAAADAASKMMLKGFMGPVTTRHPQRGLLPELELELEPGPPG